MLHSDDFLVSEDTSSTLRRDAVSQLRVYPVPERAGPSTYISAVDRIATRFLPSAARDGLDDDEYNRQLDYYAGRDGPRDGEEQEDELDRRVLEPAEIWNSIREWILGTEDYYVLVESIDYQYDFNPKIGYWEDFLSKLTFLEDPDKRDQYFKSISLEDHIRQLGEYLPPSMAKDTPPTVPLPLDPPPVDETTRNAAWAVKIVPREFIFDHLRR